MTVRRLVAEHRITHGLQVGKLLFARTLWLLFAVALALLACDALLALGGGLRLLLDLTLAGLLLFVAVRTWRRFMRSSSPEHQVARLIERGGDELDNDLVNAIDFEDSLEQKRAGPDTEAFMARAIDRAVERSQGIPVAARLRPKSLRREARLLASLFAGLLAAAVLFPDMVSAVLPRFFDPYGDHPPWSPTTLAVSPERGEVDYGDNLVVQVKTEGPAPKELWLVRLDADGRERAALPMSLVEEGSYVQTFEAVREGGRYLVRFAGGRSKRMPLIVRRTPRIDSVKIRYEYPAYTHHESVELLVSEGRLRAYAGTKATLTLYSNRPLSGGTLRMGDEKRALRPGESRTASVSFTMRKPGPFTAEIVDVDGLRGKEPLQGSIEIVPDLKPEVAVVNPGKDAFAVADAKVGLTVEATDDIGIKRVDLFRSVNGKPHERETLWKGEGADIFADAVKMLDLAAMGVKPGDTIEYHATATDHKPGRAQTGASPSYRVTVITHEQFRKLMQERMNAEALRRKYRRLRNRLAELAAKQRKLEEESRRLKQRRLEQPDQPLTPPQRQALTDQQARQERLAQQTAKLAADMAAEAKRRSVVDVEDDYKRELQRLQRSVKNAEEHMRRAVERLRRAQQGGPQQTTELVGRAGDDQRRAAEELERQQYAFEQKIDRVNQDIERIVKLLEDVERFKELVGRQKDMERQSRPYRDTPPPDLKKEQVDRLEELSDVQEEIRKELAKLEKDFRAHAKEIEKDYPQVARDARGIADEMNRRGIEGLMSNAAAELNEPDPKQGWVHADEAFEQMMAMVQKCEGVGRQAAAQCELRLKISMGANLGDSLSQLMSGSKPGRGQGQGRGRAGRGQSGQSGGRSPYAIYGSETAGMPTDESGGGAGRKHRTVRNLPRALGAMAKHFEEITVTKDSGDGFEAGGGERFVEEYRRLIEAYFERLAEEE